MKYKKKQKSQQTGIDWCLLPIIKIRIKTQSRVLQVLQDNHNNRRDKCIIMAKNKYGEKGSYWKQ